MIDLFAALGFSWNREKIPQQIPTHSIDRVTFHFHRMLTTYVWDASVLEGNPFTFPEVKTLLEGVTVGGRKISDQEQVLKGLVRPTPSRGSTFGRTVDSFGTRVPL